MFHLKYPTHQADAETLTGVPHVPPGNATVKTNFLSSINSIYESFAYHLFTIVCNPEMI